MKFCAYMMLCLCLPVALLAEEEVEKGSPEATPEDDAAAAEAVADPGFERYRVIRDRMPFGIPPPGFNPDAPGGGADGPRGAGAADAETAAEAEASEVEQQILSSVDVSMLNRTPDGRIFVGFTDKSVQPPRSYLLRVGEKREGCEWEVVSASPEDRQVKLSKGGVEASLKLGGGSGPSEEKEKEGEGAEKNAAARPGLMHRRPHPLAAPEGSAGAERKMVGLEGVRARHQERRERQMAEAEQQRQAAEQAKQEREQEKREREQAAEERKEQLAKLMQIQVELRAAREEKLAEAERRAAEEEAHPPPPSPQPGDAPDTNPN